MKYSLSSATPANLSTDCLVVPVTDKTHLTAGGKQLDAASNKALSKILHSGDLAEAQASTLLLHGIEGIKAKRVLLVNCGEAGKLDGRNMRKALQGAMKVVAGLKARNVHFLLTEASLSDQDGSWLVSQTVQQVEDSLYCYDATKSKKAPKPALKEVGLTLPETTGRAAASSAIKQGKAISAGVNVARELGNLPGNVCTPSYLAGQCKKLAEQHSSIKTQVLGEKQMQRLGMGSLLSVSAGSDQEAKLIVVQYQGSKKANSRPYVLVGKGITFDTGGISLKPGAAMDEMKFDMCGAASVVGALTSVARLQLPVNVIGIIPSAENMPGGRATKPGDVVTSMSGKTIEILNTDAEGRL
ncbi:MAG: leucyl aminopeptidase, partial [Pseudomonadales bacterium]|nr:leucyl aminopeptidase [Pseudomonadales bacterium]